ncbi:MAG TPA: RNA polymerase sigma factor [Sedimentisphaerales bacterium]|nr:RNA polymerase sigma factor [Sedimentisphaerales bacterium]
MEKRVKKTAGDGSDNEASGSLKSELEVLFDKYGQALYACALSVTGCPGFAEDAVQEAFFRIFRLGFRPDNLKAYVFRSVRNIAIDQIRRNAKLVDLNQDFIFDSSWPDSDLEANEFRKAVAQVLMILSADERETIVQHIYGGLTFREIAEIRGDPVGTVASWYRRGLAKMKAHMERRHGQF